MAGPVSVTCPLCRVAFDVPTEVVGVDEARNLAYVRMDRSELHGHLAECAARQGDKAGAALVNGEPTKALTHPPIAQPHDLPPFVARGKRPCVMCGMENGACMESLLNTVPCCGACGEGNTHPTRHETVPCAVWASEQTSGATD